MKWLDRLLRRRRIYDDLSEEIRSHLEERADELMRGGMSRADAMAAARRAFGNVTRLEEEGRTTWEWPTLESFVTDVRYALRQLRRTPVTTAIMVLTLAIGIAATSTVFSWTRSVLLDPIPGAGDPSRIEAIETTSASGSWTPTAWLDFRDFRSHLRLFDGLAAAFPTSVAIGDQTHAERQWAEVVSANFFDVLRVRPALGHFFPAALDSTEGADPVIVIGHGLWMSRFQGDSSVIGRVLHVNGYPFTIVGVAPAVFRGSVPGEQFEIWVPASMLGHLVPTGGWWLRDRGTRTFRVLARLAPGVEPEVARQEVNWLATFMGKVNGGSSTGMSGLLLPMWESHWGVQDALRAPLIVLLGACGLVLLIVCANTANLLLARATGRRRELGLRLALGAPRRRLIRQLLTEASVLAVLGSALGLAGAVWLARSLHWLLPSFAVPSLVTPSIDGGVLAFTALLTCGVTLVAGIAPAFYGSRQPVGEVLADGGRAAVGGHATRVRNVLVAAEMGLAVISLVGTGLFYLSFHNTRAVQPGFAVDHVAMGSVSLVLAGYDSARADAFLTNVTADIERTPGVSAVSYTDYVPLSLGSGSWEDLNVEGYAPRVGENMKLSRAVVGPGYFETMGIPLHAGRGFTLADDSSHTPVMVVNDAFVQRYLRGGSAIGVRVRGWGKWFTIVGVAADVKSYRLTDRPTPYFYVPVRQVYRPEYGYTFVARTNGPVAPAVDAIRSAVRAVDPTVPVYDAMPLSAYVAAPLSEQRSALQLIAVLAAVDLFLAAIGLYGVVAFSVSQRRREIGVRIALGAQLSDVVRVVAAQSVTLLAAGLAIGLVGAIVLARLVASMLFGVAPGDVGVFAAAAATMVLITVAATGVPARRAMRVDPAEALRAD